MQEEHLWGHRGVASIYSCRIAKSPEEKVEPEVTSLTSNPASSSRPRSLHGESLLMLWKAKQKEEEFLNTCTHSMEIKALHTPALFPITYRESPSLSIIIKENLNMQMFPLWLHYFPSHCMLQSILSTSAFNKNGLICSDRKLVHFLSVPHSEPCKST